MKKNDAAQLEISGRTVHYYSAISALENMTSPCRKKLVALLGANGAGKTTQMARSRACCRRTLADAGDITVNGVSCARAHPATITRRGIALVQDGRQCFGA